MRTSGFSLRTIFGLTIGFMGALALLQALVSGEVHRSHAYDNQRLSLQRLIRLKADDLLAELARKSGELGASVQMATGFQQALGARNAPALERMMRNQFRDYFVTTGMLKLEELAVFDPGFAPVAQVRDQASRFTSSAEACAPLIERARERRGPERMKLLSGLCVRDNQPYHAVIQPIGGLRLKGYMTVVTDPSHNLTRMEAALGMPLAILLPDRRSMYRSDKWPATENTADSVRAEYTLVSESAEPVLILAVTDDVRPLMGYLPQTRLVVMSAVALITLAGILLAIWVLRRTALWPLQMLTDHLTQVRNNRALLRHRIEVGGSSEVRVLAGSFNDMSGELGKLYETLEAMAFTDQLTGLPNRNRLQERVERLVQLHRDTATPFALLVMDLDRFKVINETLGHHVGDLLLKAVGARLERVLRTTPPVAGRHRPRTRDGEADVIARLGGDEFSVLLPGVSNAVDAGTITRRLAQAMEEPFEINGHELLVNASIGIVLHPLHGESLHDLMSRADVAMYHAKKTRAVQVVYESGLDGNSLRRLTLERDLHHAVGAGQLVLHYQPKINLETGMVCGAEALVRWRHPELGMVPPDEFISLAEQTGQIRALTAWVLERAAQDCSAWRRQQYDLGVSVNLSAVNLHERDLSGTIRGVLERWQLDSAQLVLELTESAVMSDPNHALQVLARLRESGVGLSVDDFGTGYSSLAYLRKLPVTEIKVDRSFVRDLAKNDGDESIIRAVVALARHRGLTMVAEGVEDRQTFERLAELGCTMVQGYYIARPMPYEEFLTWLATSDRRPDQRRQAGVTR